MQTLTPLLLAVVVGACGGQTHRDEAAGGGSTIGGGAAAGGGVDVAGNAAAGAAGGVSVTMDVEQCPYAAGPAPQLELLQPEPISILCGVFQHVALLRLGNTAGASFEWSAQMLASNMVFTPSPASGSACNGYSASDAGVTVRFPPTATPGDSASGTLRVTLRSAPIAVRDADVVATVVKAELALDPSELEFGSVPIGQTVTLTVTVHDLSLAELPDLKPAAALPPPFRYTPWRARHGEDGPNAPPIPAGGSDTIMLAFSPTTAGDFSAALELTPFDGAVPASCGATQLLRLHGAGMAP